MANINLSITVDENQYQHAQAVFAFLGTDVESALKKMIERAAYDEYPEYVHLHPNSETLKAMQECEDILNGKIPAKRYTNVHEMFAEILAEEDDE